MSKLLGSRLRDRLSGFTGIACTYTEFFNGTQQYGLQPPCGTDGKLPETQFFDAPQLELVEAASSDLRIEPNPEFMVTPLGVQVNDTVTGFVGTAMRRTVFLNGCVYYHVEGKFNSTTGKADSEFVAHQQLDWPQQKAPGPASSQEQDPASSRRRESRGGPAFRVPAR
jgi:hypothetical protein